MRIWNLLSMDKFCGTEYTNYLKSFAWKKKSRWVKGLTKPWWLSKKAKGRCCLLPFLPAEETHHLTYYFIFNIGWSWFDFEQPCWHLVPMSKFAHGLVSKPFLWKQPVRFFINFYLRATFIILWSICKPVFSIPFWYGIYYLIAYLEEMISTL